MRLYLALVVLCTAAAAAQTAPAPAKQSAPAPQNQTAPVPNALQNGLPAAEAPKLSPELPPVPRGKSTVIGGVLQNVDLVRDQMRLKVFGGQKMKILFDERTLAYRDGKRISVLQLKPNDHVSVETTLDGTAIFALRIHLLSNLPEGDVSGQIASYDPTTREMTIAATRSAARIVLEVPAGTPVSSIAQNASEGKPMQGFAFAPGSIVTAEFKPQKGGRGVATSIKVFAAPGTRLVFRGHLSSLDLHAGRLVIIDPETDEIHTIQFDPGAFPIASTLRKGSNVKVTATFTGATFVAVEIKPEE